MIESNKITSKNFVILLLFITAAGALIRFINMNYASLWADELYSMLSIYPGNSWYEILYMQRTYQPPAYFMLLWEWTKIFGYTEFAARLISVIAGTLAIFLSGMLGKKINGARLGILLALLVAFNPAQIYYSLEARFYIFTYCIAVCSLWLHWHLLTNKPKNFILYFLLAVVNTTLCYFHHFGLFFVFGLFVHDTIVFIKEKKQEYYLRKIVVYVLSAIFYAPWFFWGLLKGIGTTQFWLKDIDVWNYFSFYLASPLLVNIILALLVAYFIIVICKKETINYLLFPIIVLFVILLPLLYSIFRIPILVDRYGMVMVPALYLMICMSLLHLTDRLSPKLQITLVFIFIALISVPGVYLSTINKQGLAKQPWRQMSQWLKKQPDYLDTKIYSEGIKLKNRFTIDFYLLPQKKADHVSTIDIGKDKKMYLVETNGIWQIPDSVLNLVKKEYDIAVIPFQENLSDYGRIFICTKKQ